MPATHHTAALLHVQRNETDRFLPEGPRAVVVEDRPALAWVNIQTAEDAKAGDIHVRFWDGEHRVYTQSKRPAFLIPTDRPDTLFVGRDKEVDLLHLVNNTFHPLAAIDDQSPRTMINDGNAVPDGRAVVFGTKDIQFKDPIANLYLFTLGDNEISVLADRQTCSNGKVFAPDASGLLLYDIDTPKRNVTRYRLDVRGRSVSDSDVVLDVSKYDGFPDGMVDGGDGTVVIAFYNPAAVSDGRARRFDLRTGRVVEEWTVSGSPRVTCPLLLDHDGRIRLVLTTATEGMPADQRQKAPNAGDLFMAETTVKVLPAVPTIRLGETR